MKQLDNFIHEKLKINSNSKINEYTCQPQNKNELISIIKKRLFKNIHADLNDIDVSKIKNMSFLFDGLNPHNIHIEYWDVSNVEYMNGMFYKCRNFNCDLSQWDVSNVKDMRGMFENCFRFEGNGLENWNVSNTLNMSWMFENCLKIKNKPSWYHE